MARGTETPEAAVSVEPAVEPAAVSVEPAETERWVRVRNNESGHEVTKLASVVVRARKGLYTLLDKPAVTREGKPLAPKPRRELGE